MALTNNKNLGASSPSADLTAETVPLMSLRQPERAERTVVDHNDLQVGIRAVHRAQRGFDRLAFVIPGENDAHRGTMRVAVDKPGSAESLFERDGNVPQAHQQPAERVTGRIDHEQPGQKLGQLFMMLR